MNGIKGVNPTPSAPTPLAPRGVAIRWLRIYEPDGGMVCPISSGYTLHNIRFKRGV